MVYLFNFLSKNGLTKSAHGGNCSKSMCSQIRYISYTIFMYGMYTFPLNRVFLVRCLSMPWKTIQFFKAAIQFVVDFHSVNNFQSCSSCALRLNHIQAFTLQCYTTQIVSNNSLIFLNAVQRFIQLIKKTKQFYRILRTFRKKLNLSDNFFFPIRTKRHWTVLWSYFKITIISTEKRQYYKRKK